MPTSSNRSLTGALRALAAAGLAALAGCATTDAQRAPAPASQGRPVTAAASITGFSAALRCMDGLLADYGARDISVIVEDFADPAQRTKANTRELLIAAVSDMTQRSRAIRLVASGKDWGNTVNYLAESAKRDSTAVVPQYALRGTLSQNDSGATSVLSVDLSMLSTQDMSVVPGIATRNSAVLTPGSHAELRKFGAAFSVPARDGQGEAVRAVVELAAIEIFGRLTRVPYWTCLGATAASESVSGEIQDWYDALAARPADIIKYYQAQMRLRRAYDGPIDGTVSPELKDAVARYREALGLSREPRLSLDFFSAYLNADHRQVVARLAPPASVAATAAGNARPATVAAAPVPLSLRIATANDARRFARGEAVQLKIQPSRDAHVYCFLQDEKRRIVRFFPNRFQHDSRVAQAEGLQLPGAMRFEITMNTRGVTETVACFATEREVLPLMPATVNAGDFEPLPIGSLEQLRSAFAKVADGVLAQESFQIQPK
jgi:peptidoglycan hydrolase-like protein with peptidoglycan-binding domain